MTSTSRNGALILVLLTGLILPCLAGCTTQDRRSRNSSGDGPNRPQQATSGSQDDLATVQGTWEREMGLEQNMPYRRMVKQITGNRETVTYYGADGEVVRAHTVDFKLERRG